MISLEELERRVSQTMKSLTEDQVRWDQAREVVEHLGYEITETNVEQMFTYLSAYEIFIQRNSVYEDLWKDYGWMDCLVHIRSKAMRLVRKFWRDDPAHDEALLDDVFDLINYSVFFIRNYITENKWGRQ